MACRLVAAGTCRSRPCARFVLVSAGAPRRHFPAADQAVGNAGSTRSAIIGGFHPPLCPTPSPASATGRQNTDRRPIARRCPDSGFTFGCRPQHRFDCSRWGRDTKPSTRIQPGSVGLALPLKGIGIEDVEHDLPLAVDLPQDENLPIQSDHFSSAFVDCRTFVMKGSHDRRGAVDVDAPVTKDSAELGDFEERVVGVNFLLAGSRRSALRSTPRRPRERTARRCPQRRRH